MLFVLLSVICKAVTVVQTCMILWWWCNIWTILKSIISHLNNLNHQRDTVLRSSTITFVGTNLNRCDPLKHLQQRSDTNQIKQSISKQRESAPCDLRDKAGAEPVWASDCCCQPPDHDAAFFVLTQKRLLCYQIHVQPLRLNGTIV